MGKGVTACASLKLTVLWVVLFTPTSSPNPQDPRTWFHLEIGPWRVVTDIEVIGRGFHPTWLESL